MIVKIVDSANFIPLWDRIRPLFEKCFAKAAKGEITADDAAELIARGRAIVIVGFDSEGIPEVIAAFEPNIFPRLKTLNLFALAGTSNGVMRRYVEDGWLERIKAWAVEMGYEAIDCWTSAAMQRIVKRYGFEQQYIHSRLLLEE